MRLLLIIFSLIFIVSCKDKEWNITDSSFDANSAFSGYILSDNENAKITIHHPKYNENYQKGYFYASGYEIEINDEDYVEAICTYGNKNKNKISLNVDKKASKMFNKTEDRSVFVDFYINTDSCSGNEFVHLYNFDTKGDFQIKRPYEFGLTSNIDHNYLVLDFHTLEKKFKEKIIFPILDNTFTQFRDFRDKDSKSYADSIKEYELVKSKNEQNEKKERCAEYRAWRDYYLNKGDFAMYDAYLDSLSRLGCSQ